MPYAKEAKRVVLFRKGAPKGGLHHFLHNFLGDNSNVLPLPEALHLQLVIVFDEPLFGQQLQKSSGD